MKTTCKRLYCTLMSVIAVIVLNAETVATIGELRYSLSGAYASVYGVAPGSTASKIVIPSTITYEGLNYTVNEISWSAFNYNYAPYVEDVILPNTIKTIGAGAFSGSKIIKMIIPESVTSFGTSVFENCDKLRTLIYLGETPPSSWTKTSFTYVPDKTA